MTQRYLLGQSQRRVLGIQSKASVYAGETPTQQGTVLTSTEKETKAPSPSDYVGTLTTIELEELQPWLFAVTLGSTGNTDLAGGYLAADVVKIHDDDDSHELSFVWNEAETSANRTFNFLVHGGNRSLDLYESLKILDGQNIELHASGGEKAQLAIDTQNAERTLDLSENLTVANGYNVTLQALGQANSVILNESLTIGDGTDITITGVTAARTFTLNESFTIGDGNDGTLTFSAASKVLTVDESETISNYHTDARGDARYYTQTDIDTWRSNVLQQEMDYLDGVTSDIQDQLDARCLESVFGTAISTGLLLAGTDLKTSAVLQKYHAIDPAANVQSLLGAANDAAILALLSGDAGAAFSWNSQNLTSVGTIGCGNITATAIGIGVSPGDDALAITFSPVDDSVAYGITVAYNPTVTVNSTVYYKGIDVVASHEGVVGEKNSGYIRAMHMTVFGGVGDLAELQGFGASYGHFGGDTGTTDNVYGIQLYPYYEAGTITNFYSLFIKTAYVGGTVTNEWGIYQQDNAPNYLAGDLDLANHNGSTLGLKLGGTLVTASAAELNLCDGASYGANDSGGVGFRAIKVPNL